MTNRKCYKCRDIIHKGEFELINAFYYNTNSEYIEKIWNSEYIELYCCACFTNKIKQIKKETLRKEKEERLIRQAQNRAKKYGFIYFIIHSYDTTIGEGR